MKHLEIFESNTNVASSYNDYINQAVLVLNTSAIAQRSDDEHTHVKERLAIVGHIRSVFPDKTDDDVISNILNHQNINDIAVNDFIYYHHRTFPGPKNSIMPYATPLATNLGFHIVSIIEGDFAEKAKTTVNQTKPATVLGYFNVRAQKWVNFRVDDTELYKISKTFKDACIVNGLQFIDGKGKRDEFTPLVEYIRDYHTVNADTIEVLKQYNHIGWNADYTQFVNPRNKELMFNFAEIKQQRAVDYGYVQKGNDPFKNVNDMLEVIKYYPLAVAVYAAPFINTVIDGAVIDANCITIDIFGPKGKGKNLMQYVALNPIGVSSEKSPLMRSWAGTTGPGVAAMVRFHNSHVVCLEESHRAKTEVLEDFAYHVFNSTLGEKANTDGTGRDDGRLSSIIVSSGERSIAERVKNDGLSRRILPMNINDILGNLINNANNLSEFHNKLGKVLKESYGIAIDPFLEYVMQNKKCVQERYDVLFNQYITNNESSLFDSEKHRTFAKYVSCTQLVLEVLHKIYNLTTISPEEIVHICDEIHQYCMALCTKQNKNIEALSEVYNFAAINVTKHFTGNNANHAQMGAFEQRNINGQSEKCLLFINTELKKLLTEKGYVAENTIEYWKELGILYGTEKSNGNGKTKISYSFQSIIGGQRVSCSIFIGARVEEILNQIDDSVVDTLDHPKLANIVNFSKK